MIDARPGGYEGRKENEMRLSYYQFPEGTAESTLLENGCGVILKSGHEIFPDTIPADKREQVERVNDFFLCSIAIAKQYLKKYGGCAWTEHYERDGSLFEVTPIQLTGNNSRFKYNHHL